MASIRPKFSRRVFVTGSVVSTAFSLGASAQSARPKVQNMLVFIGTYTNGNSKSKGIYAFKLDGATGTLTPVGLVATTANPSFLAIHPNRKFLYAANEVESFAGAKSGAVTAFAIDPVSGTLTALNQQASRGGAPCHLVVDRAGKNVLVANYSGGNVAVLPVGADGKLGAAKGFVQHTGKSVDPGRQEGPHAHSFNLSPDNRFAFAADLGLDKVLIYRFDPGTSSLLPNDPPAGEVPPGSGPRHFAFHPNGRYAYVINEMKSTVTMFDYDGSKGALTARQTLSTLPAGFTGNSSTAEVQVHPSGRFVYGSNRGHDSIAIFSVDPKNGQLAHIGNESTRGKTPRNFGIDPTGNFLIAANQGSDSLVVFRIDQRTGTLAAVGAKVDAPVPVCVKFLPID